MKNNITIIKKIQQLEQVGVGDEALILPEAGVPTPLNVIVQAVKAKSRNICNKCVLSPYCMDNRLFTCCDNYFRDDKQEVYFACN